MKYVDLIVSILSGLAVCIPLVVNLVNYMQKNIRGKNWVALVSAAYGYMTQAEKMTANGAGKKEWVMSMVEQTAKTVSFDYDDDARAAISSLVDQACKMSKVVNS